MLKKNTDDSTYYIKDRYVWKVVIYYFLLHIAALHGLWILPRFKWPYLVFFFVYQVMSTLGVTMGAHRYYSHKCFKANPTIRFFLVFLMTYAGQNSVFNWVRDHRVHHKFVDTDSDPYNAKRGLFFAHMGWFMQKKHPSVIEKGRKLDLSDITADSIVMFQHKYYKVIFLILMLIPIQVSVYFWNENWFDMFTFMSLAHVIGLQRTFLVNSVGHCFGTKPYNRNITATENIIVSYFSLGEGWHNYHHAFPSDYRSSEYGLGWTTTTLVIDACAYMGWVWDLKAAPAVSVQRALKKSLELEKANFKLLH